MSSPSPTRPVRIHLSAEALTGLRSAAARPEARGKGFRIYPVGVT